MTDKPYDEAKKRWMMIALYAVIFAAFSLAFRHNVIPFHAIFQSFF